MGPFSVFTVFVVVIYVFGAVDKTSSSFSAHGKIGNFIIIIHRSIKVLIFSSFVRCKYLNIVCSLSICTVVHVSYFKLSGLPADLCSGARCAIAMMFVRASVCPSVHLSGTSVYCDMVHFSADLSLWLDSVMFWAP